MAKVRTLFSFVRFLNLSVAKLRTVNIISADFQGETGVFSLCMSISLVMNDDTEHWLGVYQSDAAEEDEQEQERHIPPFCLRRATWETKKDCSLFRRATNKKEYVKEKGAIEGRIMFGTPELYSEIGPLMEELEQLVRQGIALQPIEGTEFLWNRVRVDIRREISFSLEYSFNQGRNAPLEVLVERWYTSFSRIDVAGGIIPDTGCFISYSFPIEDVLERF